MRTAQSVFDQIQKKYQTCLQKQVVPDDLLVDVKDCLANLRSALDYLWCKVPSVDKGSSFPVANSQVDFLGKSKGVDSRYSAIAERWQSYHGDSWLENFNYIRNKNVHLTLVPQIRKETKEFSVKKTGESGTTATFRGCFFGGDGNHISIHGIPMPINLKTQLPVDVEGLDIERKIWVDFLFDGSSISATFPKNISVLPFLRQSLENVKTIILEVEAIL